MKKMFLHTIICLFVFTANAQNLVSFKNESNKYGYKDSLGNIKISPKYDYVYPYSEGLAAVCVNEKWGFIDKTGKVVISLKYSITQPFSEGLAAVNVGYDEILLGMDNYVPIHHVEGGKWGYIDKTGKEIIPLKYDNAQPFIGDFALVNNGFNRNHFVPVFYAYGHEQNGTWGFVNKVGKEVVPVKYAFLRSFHDGLAMVGENNYFSELKYGFINTVGEEIISVQYNFAKDFSNGLALVGIGKDSDSLKYGFIDTKGLEIIPFLYIRAESFSEGLSAVGYDDGVSIKYGFIDTKGKIIIPFDYDSALSFYKNKAWVKKEGRFFYIDKNGKEIKEK